MPEGLLSRRVGPDPPSVTDKSQLLRFPKTRGDGRMALDALIGTAEAEAVTRSGSIEFVATGDTGVGLEHQAAVVEAMTHDFRADQPAAGATFFLNLGDIIYGPHKRAGYANKFYRPNMPWLHPAPGFDGLVLGIPGNHDGEVRDPSDAPTLQAFLENFCTAHTPRDGSMAASFNVKMPNQPGAYWWLSAPFLNLVGLYSNAAEDFGALGADARETHQAAWLGKTLKAIAAEPANGGRKALVLATHHPPYNQGLNSGGRGHPGSPGMLAQIDDACRAAGVWPDLFLSGHSHNYQRYMRTVTTPAGDKVIPYLIAGTGGISSQPVPANLGNFDPAGRVRYANARGLSSSGEQVFGYLRVHASRHLIQATFVQTFADHRTEIETVAIDLATGQETSPDFVS